MKIYRKQRDVLLTEEAEGMFDTIESNDISSIPELSSDQKATADIIRGIIEELPELQKSAVIAYYYDGFKVEQIADMMECSVNTIKSRLNYARKYIKDRVEEKEKKEGYRLHAFGLPVLWFSIRMLAEETKLTAHAAQNVYNGVCSSVGLQSTAISMSVAGGATTGTASGAATIVGEATKAAGLGAKFASLSTSVKALIIAGTVAVAGLGTAEMVSIMNNQPEEVVEESVEESIATDVNIENLTLEGDLSEYLYIHPDEDENKILYPTKISDMEYCFYADDLAENFEQNEVLRLASFLPEHLGVSFVRFNFPTSLAHPAKTMNEYHDVQFELQTGYDIIVEVAYMENITYEILNESFEDEQISIEESEEVMEEPKTLADMNLREYEVWEPENGSGSTLYVKQIGSETVEIVEGIYQTTVEYEGYWTLDGQELHFTGKDLEILELTDLEGNLIDRRIAFYYLSENGMIFVDIPNEEGWESYAFRDIPDYVYKKMSAPVLDEEGNLQTSASSTANEQGIHLTNAGTTWQLTDTVTMHFENGVFTVSGTGDMPDYNANDEVAPWTYDVFRGDPTTVIIEEGITSISPMAFSGYLNISEVSLPSSLREIGDRAFSSCNSLQEITIPDGVEKIGDKVFFNSRSLKKIEIPASVTEIGDGIFMSGNSNLVIYGEKGSTAEQYAEKWEIIFEEK